MNSIIIMGRESPNKQCYECANCKEPTTGWSGSRFRCAFLGKDFGTWHYDVPDECPCKGKGWTAEKRRYTATMAEFDANHSDRAAKHYDHAKEKHPYFCDRLLPDWTVGKIKSRIAVNLECARTLIKAGIRDHNLMWNEIVNCEVWEATEAMFNGNKAHAVEELYDTIAVLLRTIDVLEGRQELGNPETKGETK